MSNCNMRKVHMRARSLTNGAGYSSLQLWCVPTPRGIAFQPVLDPLDLALHEPKLEDTRARPVPVIGERLVSIPGAMLRIIPEWVKAMGLDPKMDWESSISDGSETP